MNLYYIPKEQECHYHECNEVLSIGHTAIYSEGDLFCEKECLVDYLLDGIEHEEIELTSNRRHAK